MTAIFNRLLAYVMLIVLFIFPAEKDNFRLKIKEEVTTQTQVIAFEYKNMTNRQVTHGLKCYSIDKKEGKDWVEVEKIPAYVIETAIIVNPTQKETVEIDLMKEYGHLLDKGEYRLNFEYSVMTDLEHGEKLISTFYFTIDK